MFGDQGFVQTYTSQTYINYWFRGNQSDTRCFTISTLFSSDSHPAVYAKTGPVTAEQG